MNRKEGNTDFSSKSDGKSNTAYPLLTVNSLIGNIIYAYVFKEVMVIDMTNIKTILYFFIEQYTLLVVLLIDLNRTRAPVCSRDKVERKQY